VTAAAEPPRELETTAISTPIVLSTAASLSRRSALCHHAQPRHHRATTSQVLMPEKGTFAVLLRWWRAQRGLSQLALAGRAGISQRHLSFLELCRAQPSRDRVGQVAAGVLKPFLTNWPEVVRYFIHSVEADAAADGTKETAALLVRLRGYEDVREAVPRAPTAPSAPVLPMHFRKGNTSLKLFTTI